MTIAESIPVDLRKIGNQLPNLIYETNFKKQLANIVRWLQPIFPIESAGLSIYGCGPDDMHINSINIDEATVEKIVGLFRETNRNGLVHDGIMLFDTANQNVSAVSSDQDIIIENQEAHGLAFRLQHLNTAFGTLILIVKDNSIFNLLSDAAQLQWFSSMVSNLLYNTCIHYQNIEKLRILNLYETVSSALCYTGDLQELLTTIIAIIVSELPCEEGSILLYDTDSNELEFFSAMGETGEGFIQTRFPANKGIAGKALQEGLPVIVNDVQTSPFFFNALDKQSGFQTKTILATPIISGKEKVGVIEAINKVGKDCFDERDKRTLMAIADEIGLAVKNARIFDYVVNSYCKMRQGQMSCKGCVRPLKSWTPCARQLAIT